MVVRQEGRRGGRGEDGRAGGRRGERGGWGSVFFFVSPMLGARELHQFSHASIHTYYSSYSCWLSFFALNVPVLTNAGILFFAGTSIVHNWRVYSCGAG